MAYVISEPCGGAVQRATVCVLWPHERTPITIAPTATAGLSAPA
jgi:hypothetical protein